MSKIDYKKQQDKSELECVKRFLLEFNQKNNTHFSKPAKYPEDNEIDITCFDESLGETMKIQVKRSDPASAKAFGEQTSDRNGLLYSRDQDQASKHILAHIKKIEGKYKRQNKNVSDTLLLLDENLEPSVGLVSEISKHIVTTNFKEIWLVTRNGHSYKMHPI